MPKLNVDTRLSKIKRVTFANAKVKRISFENGTSNATKSQQRGYTTENRSINPSVAITNNRRDTRATAFEQHVQLKPILSPKGDVLVINPNPAFVVSEEPLVINPNQAFVVSEEPSIINPNPASEEVDPIPVLFEEKIHVKHDQDAANFQLAIYIAMAHAGLVLAIVTCYGVGLLLKDQWIPIEWAILISMPLHQVQCVVVTFWMRHLEKGLVETVFAVPIVLLSALLKTARDVHAKFWSLCDGAASTNVGENVTFLKLCDWLFSMGTCTLLYENLGLVYTMAITCVACAMYWLFNGFHFVVTANFGDLVLHNQGRRHSAARFLAFTRWSNQGLAQTLTKNLPSLVALGLIVLMILVVVGGTILFSFKVGVEAKDAVVVLKLKMENSKSMAGIEFSNWLEPNSVESHMMVAYATVVQKVDEYVARNNMTAMANTVKEFLNAMTSNDTSVIVGALSTTENSNFWEKLVMTFQLLKEKFEKRELRQALKNLVKSGEGFMTGSFYVLVVFGTTVANFIRQLLVFTFVLFFLITSETGGVMQQVLEVVPLSEVTRQKCATVLDRTISTVLLTTGKLMLFQALFTYLFFRFLKIHFLYMSTCIALVQAMMPIFPKWIASLPALLQLLAERKYVRGLSTTFVYKSVMDYGFSKIHGAVSNYSQYLTGLSIAGGMALFQPAICGVIMGPLILTVLIAIRDLYSEFVLKVFTNYQRI